MTRRVQALTLGAVMAVVAGPAAAQPEPPEEAADPEGDPPADLADPEPPVDEPLESTQPPEPEAEPEPGPPAVTITGPILPRSYLEWPQARVLRPRTLPRGTWALGLDLRAELDFETARVAGGLAADPARTGAWFAFGLTDQAEFDLSYSFALKDFELRGPLQTGAAFNLIRDGVIDVSARAGLGWNFDTTGFSPLTAGLDTRYLLNARMAILLLPRQLVWSLDDPGDSGITPVFLDLPVGFALQATPALYLQIDALLLRWGIRDSTSSFIGDDFAPVQARLFWSPSNQLDVGAGIGADLVAPGQPGITDTLTLLLQARYYGVD
jgi:hypothetical protein